MHTKPPGNYKQNEMQTVALAIRFSVVAEYKVNI